MKILILGAQERYEKYLPQLLFIRQQELVFWDKDTPQAQLLAHDADADILFVDAITPVTASLMAGMPKLKLVHSEGVAYDKIDLAAARERGVYVCNNKGCNAGAVAEQAIMLMLMLLRRAVSGDRAVREGRQIEVKENHMLAGDLKELADCTIGYVGFGDIAQAVARMADIFGARNVYYCPSGAKRGIETASYLPLDELLAVSDIVSLHLPVTPETVNTANSEFFAKMKDGSYLVNTARGELVDSEALLSSIRSGKLAGAGLDCVAGEPVREDNVILQAEKEVEDKLIFSPHVGGITASSFKRGYKMLWENVARIEAGERPEHIVNLW